MRIISFDCRSPNDEENFYFELRRVNQLVDGLFRPSLASHNLTANVNFSLFSHRNTLKLWLRDIFACSFNFKLSFFVTKKEFISSFTLTVSSLAVFCWFNFFVETCFGMHKMIPSQYNRQTNEIKFSQRLLNCFSDFPNLNDSIYFAQIFRNVVLDFISIFSFR